MAAFNTPPRSVSPRCDGALRAPRKRSPVGSLVGHERPALVVPRWARRGLRRRVGRLRFVGRRLWSRLRQGVVLRRRRDDDNRIIAENLGTGGKRCTQGEQRNPCGQSNVVDLHGPVPSRQGDRGQRQGLTHQPDRKNPRQNRRTNFAYSLRPAKRLMAFFRTPAGPLYVAPQL